jgi:hypothetical protein
MYLEKQAIQDLWQHKRNRRHWDSPQQTILSLTGNSAVDVAIPPKQYLQVHIYLYHIS